MIFVNPFARIVFGYDDSAAAGVALAQALRLAEQYGGEIVAVNASDLSAAATIPVRSAAWAPAADFAALLASMDPARRELFRKLSRRVAPHEVPVTFELAIADPAEALVDAAARWNATAIAVGTHARRGLAGVLTRNVAEAVVRTAAVPVMVVHENTPLRISSASSSPWTARSRRRTRAALPSRWRSSTPSSWSTAMSSTPPFSCR